jgi:hypothetical protein
MHSHLTLWPLNLLPFTATTRGSVDERKNESAALHHVSLDFQHEERGSFRPFSCTSDWTVQTAEKAPEKID